MPAIPLNFWIIARLAEAAGVQIGRDMTYRLEPGTIPTSCGVIGIFVVAVFLIAFAFRVFEKQSN